MEIRLTMAVTGKVSTFAELNVTIQDPSATLAKVCASVPFVYLKDFLLPNATSACSITSYQILFPNNPIGIA